MGRDRFNWRDAAWDARENPESEEYDPSREEIEEELQHAADYRHVLDGIDQDIRAFGHAARGGGFRSEWDMAPRAISVSDYLDAIAYAGLDHLEHIRDEELKSQLREEREAVEYALLDHAMPYLAHALKEYGTLLAQQLHEDSSRVRDMAHRKADQIESTFIDVNGLLESMAGEKDEQWQEAFLADIAEQRETLALYRKEPYAAVFDSEIEKLLPKQKRLVRQIVEAHRPTRHTGIGEAPMRMDQQEIHAAVDTMYQELRFAVANMRDQDTQGKYQDILNIYERAQDDFTHIADFAHAALQLRALFHALEQAGETHVPDDVFDDAKRLQETMDTAWQNIYDMHLLMEAGDASIGMEHFRGYVNQLRGKDDVQAEKIFKGEDIDASLHVLGITRDASAKEIKAAYRALMRKYHPDRDPKAEEKAKQITVAFNNLKKQGFVS